MKKFIFTILLFALFTDFVTAYNPPRGVADIAGRNLKEKGNDWLEKRGYGHVGIYHPRARKVMDVSRKSSKRSKVLTYAKVYTYTQKKYWGSRYGAFRSYQLNRVINYAWRQSSFNPYYTGAPFYKEGKWKKKWYFSKWRWKSKWYKSRGWFRCDTFVRYAYRKGTGARLGGKHTRLVRPAKVHRALPYRR